MANMIVTAPTHPERTEFYLSVPEVDHGISIYNPAGPSEAKTRTYRWPYVRIVSSSSFDFVADFATRQARDAWSNWVQAYYRSVMRPDASFLQPMTFRIPSIGFEKTGLPKSASFGDDVRMVVYRATVSVVGGSSALDESGAISHLAAQGPLHAGEDDFGPRYPDTLPGPGRLRSSLGQFAESSNDVLSEAELLAIVRGQTTVGDGGPRVRGPGGNGSGVA